jgi:hypothetical protein
VAPFYSLLDIKTYSKIFDDYIFSHISFCQIIKRGLSNKAWYHVWSYLYLFQNVFKSKAVT